MSDNNEELNQPQPTTENSAVDSSSSPDQLAAELADLKDKYLRSLAEMDNFRKRATKEKSELLKYQGEPIFRDILDVFDDIERAIEFRDGAADKLRDGLEMIHKKFASVLTRWEVRAEPSVGKEFDPNRHEALSRVKVDDAKPGTVVNEFKKAFFYKDRLLRPAQVVVAEAGSPERGDG